MSENNKRVRISYTVEMDDVPSCIAQLLSELEETHDKIGRHLEKAVSELVAPQANYRAAHQSIDEARKLMMGLDLRLQDCQELLNDFQAALLSQHVQPEDATQWMPPEENEINKEEDDILSGAPSTDE